MLLVSFLSSILSLEILIHGGAQISIIPWLGSRDRVPSYLLFYIPASASRNLFFFFFVSVVVVLDFQFRWLLISRRVLCVVRRLLPFTNCFGSFLSNLFSTVINPDFQFRWFLIFLIIFWTVFVSLCVDLCFLHLVLGIISLIFF